MPKLKIIIALIFICQFLSPGLPAIWASKEQPAKAENIFANFEFATELDAYYSNIGLYMPLTTDKIKIISPTDEVNYYYDLLTSSYIPKFMVIEASLHPLANIGVYVKKNHRDFYDDLTINNSINIIESLTGGDEEPYSISLFLGNVIKLVDPKDSQWEANKGYMGYLITVGNYHIKDNEAIKDDWLLAEWKIKGDKKTTAQNLSWSLRAGGKFHTHQDINDIFYLSIRRDKMDYNGKIWSLIENSGFKIEQEFTTHGFKPASTTMLINKKWPTSANTCISLGFGFIYRTENKYSGTLNDSDSSNFTVVLQPNIEFR